MKALRRLRRRRGDAFLVEGYRQVASALDAGRSIRELYVSPGLFLGSCEAAVVSRAERAGAAVTELSPAAFESIAGRVRADGLAAVVERWPTSLDTLRTGPDSLVLVAESIERPGNLGTIVRTACAAGADAVVVCDGVTDPFHPETVSGSVGTLFRIGLAESESASALAWLRRQSFRLLVATPAGQRAHRDADFRGRTAIVVGNERRGVSPAWVEAADVTLRIPMPGPADSLNVAVAAGIVLTEAAYQRSADGYARTLP